MSLWIANGGVASAEENPIIVTGEVDYVYNGETGGTRPFYLNPKPSGDKTGYTTIIDGGKVNSEAWGGVAYEKDAQGKGDASYNTVTIKNKGWANYVYGGYSVKGNATNNSVTLTDSDANYVYGGFTGLPNPENNAEGDASYNEVRLTRSKAGYVAGGNCYYGTGKKATYNKVYLTDSTVNGSVYGGFNMGENADNVTGNELYLSGANAVNHNGLYAQGRVQNFETIHIVEAKWGTPVLTFSQIVIDENPYGILQNEKRPGESEGTWATIDASKLKFDNPETIPDGETMNLIAGPVRDVTLASTVTALQEYTVTPVTGVLLNAAFQGQLSIPSGKDALICAASNKATKLTFSDVEWKDSGALLDHATDATKNINFNGAAVDTSNIHFTNIESLEANKKMTLVSSFGDTVGTITGTKYKVGSTLEGEGKASLVGNDLIFTAETGTGKQTAREQTHNTVMGAEVGMAALAMGNDFIGSAMDGLSLASNTGADGVSSFAQMGGGSMRQETGSHVDTHTWNAILALGHKNKKERGTTEYGAFFEYGTGNYTTHAENGLRGDGSARYTGGGLLAKWTAAHGMYVEGSFRAGTVHDDARNVLSDGAGNPYSYDTNANYFGGHIGVGKEIPLANGNTVDVYGKYFVNRRNGVSFDAGGHYDLDAVTSQVLRVGARYTVKGAKWNFYAGAAYEHELDGKANGTADSVAIRGADTSGGSFRGELGATVKPGENSPWNIDFNVTGFAGKKQGFTGGVSVALMF